VKHERAVLGALLARAAGVEVWPSQGNFVFAQFPDARRVQDELSRRGIAVRGYPGRVLMDNVSLDPCLRITCPGNERDFARLCSALGEVLSIAQPL
jgi:histidinol-phosphate/aromatic aminotransferase/cobyric acid decarboxylase-like protein